MNVAYALAAEEYGRAQLDEYLAGLGKQGTVTMTGRSPAFADADDSWGETPGDLAELAAAQDEFRA